MASIHLSLPIMVPVRPVCSCLATSQPSPLRKKVSTRYLFSLDSTLFFFSLRWRINECFSSIFFSCHCSPVLWLPVAKPGTGSFLSLVSLSVELYFGVFFGKREQKHTQPFLRPHKRHSFKCVKTRRRYISK